MAREAGFGGDACADRVEFPVPQCIEQVANENDARALSTSEPFRDEMLGARLQRVPHIATKTILGEWRRLCGDEAPIEPCRAGGLNLFSEREVGAHGEDER